MKFYILILCSFLMINCKTKNLKYIDYYVKINKADSTFRLANDTLKAIKIYREVFKKYEPKNQYAKREFENYINFSDQYNLNFGGKRSLRKLIKLVAPFKDRFYSYSVLKKNGLDSLQVLKKFKAWEDKLDKVMVDSFKVARNRDQLYRENYDKDLMLLNDRKNEELLTRLFKDNNYPTVDKIGNQNEVYYDPIDIITLHISNHTKNFQYFKKELLKNVEKGYLPPITYARFIDRNNTYPNGGTVIDSSTIYDSYLGPYEIKDSAQINRNRKKIGLPSLKHRNKITIENSRYLTKMYNIKIKQIKINK